MTKATLIENLKEPWTTIFGILQIVLIPLLEFFKVITSQQGTEASPIFTQLLDGIVNNSPTVIVTALFGLYMIFFTKKNTK
jgi:hypothetical protein